MLLINICCTNAIFAVFVYCVYLAYIMNQKGNTQIWNTFVSVYVTQDIA